MEKDVLILGGGPAGLSTALHLKWITPHLAPRILILEKEHYPRPKLCAGGLVTDAEVILQHLGLDVTEIPHVNSAAAHLDFAGKGLTVRVRKRHAIRVIRRDEFDNWLAGKVREAGIEIREGITVRNVTPDADGVAVETDSGTYRAKIVIGADGSNGVTRGCIFPREPVYTARVLEVITPSFDFAPQDAFFAPLGRNHKWNEAYFDFFPVPQGIAGYVWDFPTQVKGEPMRCWGIYDANILFNGKRPQLKELLAQEMARRGFDLDDYEIKGNPIHWFTPQNRMSIPRVLLVGDAVGADPIFGEGISVALGYGAVAAREVSESIRRNEFSFNGYKFRVVRSGLGQALLARWFIAHIFYPLKWKWFQFLLWRVLKPVVLLVGWIFVLNWGKRLKVA